MCIDFVYTSCVVCSQLTVVLDVEAHIETSPRNSVGDARLNGLAMLTIHCNIDVDVKTVISDLVTLSRRRLQFVLWKILNDIDYQNDDKKLVSRNH